MSNVIPQYPEGVRRLTEDEFNKIKWGPLPKEGGFSYRNKRFDFREADYSDLEEFDTPGLSGAGVTQDFKFLMPEIINRQIITQIEDVIIGRNLLDVFRINGPVEVWLREYGFEATEVAQNSEVPVAKLRHDKIYVNVIKVGIRPELTYEVIADGQFDIMRRHIRQCGIAMAKYEDAHIFDVMNNGVPNGSTIVGTQESDHSFDGGGAFNWDSLVNAYSSIQLENLNPTDLILNPYQAAEILKLKEYRDASGAFQIFPDRVSGAITAGTLPPVLGLRIHVTRAQPAGTALMIDKNNYAALADRQPLLVEADRDVVKQLQTVVFTQRYGCGILNNDGAANITNLKTSL
jgi:HK97 family phage major capsid protein